MTTEEPQQKVTPDFTSDANRLLNYVELLQRTPESGDP
jgi:hypothetical protein